MELKLLSKFNRDDLAKYKAFKKVISMSKLELRGDAAISVASLFVWFNDLEQKIDDAIKQEMLNGAPKVTEGDVK